MMNSELRDIMNEVSRVSNSLEDKIDKKSQDVSLNNIETKHLMISNMGDIVDLMSLVNQSKDGRMSKEDKKKLDGIEAGSNKYIHPSTHPATMITTDSEHRFVTDVMISSWNNKLDKTGGNMTGSITFKDTSRPINFEYNFGDSTGEWSRGIYWKNNGTELSTIGVYGRASEYLYTYIGRDYNDTNVKFYPNKNLELKANNLNTTSKEVVGAINELNINKLTKSTNNRLIGFDSGNAAGFYCGAGNEFTFSSSTGHIWFNYRKANTETPVDTYKFGDSSAAVHGKIECGNIRSFYQISNLHGFETTGCDGFQVNLNLGYNTHECAGLQFLTDSNIFGIGGHKNDNLYFWYGNSSVDSPSGKNYVLKMDKNGDLFRVSNSSSFKFYHQGNSHVVPTPQSPDNAIFLRNDNTWQRVTPEAIGAYTKSEIDSKFSQLNSGIDWKEAVNTFDDLATTYPHPEDGWTVNVKDTDYTYRYTGSQWVAISANAIPNATSSTDGKMSKEDKAKLDTIERNANHYIHPTNHPASMITTDSNHLFVTQAQIDSWNAKADAAGGSVDSANKWKTARTITLSGDATGSVSIDGSQNVTLPVTILDNSHNHTWDNITGKPSTFPPSSHGNHVPDPQSPDNAIFLRNDNTWQRVTPEAIGALPTTGGNLTGPLKFNNGNSEIYQFIGFRGANNDLNARLSSEQMSWSYTGTGDSTQITHGFPMRHNANGILTFNTHAGLYGHQIGLSSNGNMYHRLIDDSSFGNWYQILTSKDGKLLPELESANNSRFLRNDGTWQNVTPGNIGALPSSNPKISVLANQYYLSSSNPTFGIHMQNSDLIGLNNVIFNDISDGTNENVIAWPKSDSAGTSVSNYDILRSKGNGQLLFNENEVVVRTDSEEVGRLYRQTINVGGDANTYYPVQVRGFAAAQGSRWSASVRPVE